jgi:glycine/D-amino acid oxidase-like deaminating enzyme
MATRDYRHESLWHENVPGELTPRASLEGTADVDVAIVGAGYTGLWTAYYLRALKPDIRVALVESEIAGFGASGRNGGWAIGAVAGIEEYYGDPELREGGLAIQRAMFDTVDEIGRVCTAEGIDCHFAKGGTVQVATVPPHREALQRQVQALRSLGFGEEDYAWLEPEECAARVRTRSNLGGLYTPHCAALHPARLARGLAEVVERAGATIYERSPARKIEGRTVLTTGGRLRADVVLMATEGYTRSVAGHGRRLVPIHSMMIATEPIPEEVWKEIGLSQRETFGDPRRMVIYGQRTADGRIAFGGRAGYYLGSGLRNRFRPDDPSFGLVEQVLRGFFPALSGVRITHRWGGPLGVPRDWHVGVGLDRATGRAWGGGYVGEGVAASNLIARTLADLIVERDTELVHLPWVGHRFPNWEPEPLRWVAVKGIRSIGDALDRAELYGAPAPRIRSALFRSFVRR